MVPTMLYQELPVRGTSHTFGALARSIVFGCCGWETSFTGFMKCLIDGTFMATRKCVKEQVRERGLVGCSLGGLALGVGLAWLGFSFSMGISLRSVGI